VTVVSDAPTRAEGLQLIGEMQGSGYRVAPALVRRGDGQTLQLTPLLYAVLEAVDGRRGPAEIAEVVTARTGRTVSGADVSMLVDAQLRPLGLLLRADGSAPELKRSNPLLGLRAKVTVTDPERTRRITDPFRVLFSPLVWVPVMAVFGWVTWWLLLDKGLASATYEAFQRPTLLLLVLAVTVVSAGFHEFGHAAAARRGGAQPGVMGAGIYLVWPAFYTDVTDSYRLGRLGRLRTDLGGLYFNAIVAVAIVGVWSVTRWDALLLVVATQLLQMVRQLTPLVRFDGYHVLADLTGVPDLFSRIGPTLASLWPTRWRDPTARELKPWARAVITTWVLLVVPLLLVALVAMVLAVPRLVGTAWASVRRERELLGAAVGDAEVVDAAAAAVSMVIFTFPVLAVALLLWRFGRTVATTVWARTDGMPVRRTAAALVGLALLGGVAWAWWPDAERYRPVSPDEDGTLTQLVSAPVERPTATVPASAATTGTTASAGARGRAVTVLPEGMALPGKDAPVPALVLVPEEEGDGEAAAPTWVFPFDQPLPPAEGDNQAMAVNTADGTAKYDVAMAMVWADDGEDVLNTNEAYALASCRDCVTVAVAFQVVVIVGQADVVVPQNLSAAVNYDCFRCITAAVASQLVVTVETMPGRTEQLALAQLWEEIAAFAGTIPQLGLAEITDRLEEYKQEILDILGDVVATASPPSGDAGATPGPEQPEATPTGSAGPSAITHPTPTSSAAPTSSTAATGEPAEEPAPTATRSATPTPAPTPSAASTP
jgi:putative peptide zinc metalloprotease protein